MMRAWESRGDCHVIDEPFYAAYLHHTGLNHPMREAVIASQDTDWSIVASACETADQAPIVYQKHMSQHMVAEAPLGWMRNTRHAFLIRPPAEVAASFRAKWSDARAEDLGFHRQAELFDHVCQLTGEAPLVIAARDVLTDPKGLLRTVCDRIGVPWDPAMLQWKPGRRATDGVWAQHWYASVEASTTFAPPSIPKEADPALADIVAACEGPYQRMAAHKLSLPKI